jgi:hypothetical protein
MFMERDFINIPVHASGIRLPDINQRTRNRLTVVDVNVLRFQENIHTI